MQETVLFEITEDKLETGLRGFPCGYCITSTVDPEKGLSYIGKPLTELAKKSPEEVIYLLYNGKEGNSNQVGAFSEVLQSRAKLSPKTVQYIRQLPREAHPMKLFSAALLIAGTFEGTGEYSEDSLNIIAKIPEIAATVINHHAGWGNGSPSNPALGYMENFAQMVAVPKKSESLTAVFKMFNILHYDHGGGNLSCFTGKAIASGLEDMFGSLAGAMSALAGPRHGKANQDALALVQQVLSAVGEDATAKDIERYIRQMVGNKEVIAGFGHAVLRVEDPRATLFYNYAKEHFPKHPLVKTALLLRTEGSKVLAENPRISDPHPNVDAISGTVLTAAGFPYPQYFTVLFGLARIVGISRQILYERLEAREGKGLPIVRPKYYYKPRGSK